MKDRFSHAQCFSLALSLALLALTMQEALRLWYTADVFSALCATTSWTKVKSQLESGMVLPGAGGFRGSGFAIW